MNVDKQVIHDIGVGALLHDIGLRYTTLDYEGKSMEDMKPEALAEYKKHPIYGYTSVKDEEWISDEVKKSSCITMRDWTDPDFRFDSKKRRFHFSVRL